MMNQRPLSPHLFVYKFMYTMSLSILHRITGCAAGFGFLVFVWWLMALASGPAAYASAMNALATPFAKLLLVGFTFSFVYHFCNGIRHLVWDSGRGLERAQARRSGAVVVVAALLLTAILVWFGCRAFGFMTMGLEP
jgi:succinate dehydrogenase / fumarate reductase cytochrome b subunit